MTFSVLTYRNHIFLCVFLFAVLGSCGYRFYGGGKLPGNIETVHVAVFANRTAETGLEQVFTNDMIYELMRDETARVAEPSRADAWLNGTIRSIRVASASRVNLQTTSKRDITVSGSVLLKSPSDDIIWTSGNIVVYDTYFVTSDADETENNKRVALMNMSQRFAEKVYQRMIMDF